MISMENLKSKFDDTVRDEDGHEWSQLCEECVDKLSVSKAVLDGAGSGLCGVKGCLNESDYYIDFK